jgi:hypothetical protein
MQHYSRLLTSKSRWNVKSYVTGDQCVSFQFCGFKILANSSQLLVKLVEFAQKTPKFVCQQVAKIRPEKNHCP